MEMFSPLGGDNCDASVQVEVMNDGIDKSGEVSRTIARECLAQDAIARHYVHYRIG
jgi:hypothetical protein